MRSRTEIEEDLRATIVAARRGDEKARMRLALEAQRSTSFAGDLDRAITTKDLGELAALIGAAAWRTAAAEAAHAIASTATKPADQAPTEPDIGISREQLLDSLLGKGGF